jgi:Protein of unknown function (DUF1360)
MIDSFDERKIRGRRIYVVGTTYSCVRGEKGERRMIIHNWYMFLLFAFATFRLTRLIVFDKITAFFRNFFLEEVEMKDEDGKVATYLKPKDGVIRGWIGELISCYWCTGVWCSIFLFCLYWFLPNVAAPVILILAIAGVAAIIEVIVSKLLD